MWWSDINRTDICVVLLSRSEFAPLMLLSHLQFRSLGSQNDALQAFRVFNPAFYSAVGVGVWFVSIHGMFVSSRSEHSNHTKMRKQPHRDLFIGSHSGAVHLWWFDLHLTDNYNFELNGSPSKVRFTYWHTDDQNQQLLAASLTVSRGSHWSDNTFLRIFISCLSSCSLLGHT